MGDSTRPGMTRSSSFLDSLYGSGSLELVWENGQVHVQGGSSSGVTPKTPSWGGYSIKPSDECAKNARLSTLYSLTDFPVQRHSDLNNSQQNSHQSNNQNSSQLDFEFSKSKSSDVHKVGCANLRQKPLISDASNPVFFVPRSEEAPPDEQSEAVGHNSAVNIQGSHAQYHNQTSSSAELGGKGKTDTNCFDQALLESSSLCSLGASNKANRKHFDIDDSTYLSDNVEEEPEDAAKEKPAHRVKRSRNAETHNLCERKRRDKINKRMRALKELIPNCNKMDKASILDDAIEYLKSLKRQLQIMSMGARFCMPFMMLPSATPHMINTHHLHQLMGAGMGFRPDSLPQFPITSLPGITDNRAGMFGFPNQMLPMPISQAPFIPMVANPSTQSFLATTNVPENSTSSQLTTPKASAPNNSYLSGHAEYATTQAPNQVSLDH